ncbi:hypothetical protein AO1008_01940 [Aspergillus oryzae 100-8]|uniref:Uncharacterized protein n=1 Tax=Aspergillus oryzae (strain 3.042) TaxID=1160506 RepID=I8TYD7_ASPO3|nr:hypothetical protein Ao3042_04143 [Aspergillus oryzae 3.042]KDE76181.1 hypothetical protein AO1008_01940 [Aspergillus oryzae 100-8]|eukprot:EIT79455.1 hypothetical protein Ao3042_04143 [Aspergillus oryzae 3.042]
MAEQPSSHSGSSTDMTVENKEKRTWYHSTLFNAFIIGGVGFFAPGLWNAMNSLGAGGAQSPFLINAANALVFGLMGFLCLFGGPIANRIGLNWTLLLGAVGYPIYSAALYTNNRYVQTFQTLVCSWRSANYESRATFAESIWLWFRTGGPLLGGAIIKILLRYSTYLIFVALQCLAVPLAWFLSPPEKVQRSDGSKVRIVLQDSWRAEMRELWKLSCRREVLLLLPIFWAAYFNQYSGNFTTYYFGVRARALIGFVSNFARLLSSGMISRFLDYRGISIKKRVTYRYDGPP